MATKHGPAIMTRKETLPEIPEAVLKATMINNEDGQMKRTISEVKHKNIISKRWREVSIGSICTKVTSGGTPLTSNNEYWDKGSIPWLTTKEVNFSRIYSTEKYITQAGINESSAKWIPKNSVIVAMYAAPTAGKVAVNKIPLTTNQACCNLTINDEVAYYEFVYYYLLFQNSVLANLANGAAQQNLNARIIKNFPIYLPPLVEQQAIARILGSLDDKIEHNRQMNETLEAMAHTLFKSWFVDFDPVIDNALAAGNPIPEELRHRAVQRTNLGNTRRPLPDDIQSLFPSEFKFTDEMGWIPKGWKVRSLDQIADYLNGLACQKFPPQSGEKGLPVVKIRELRNGIDEQTDMATALVPEEYIVNYGDILFSWSGSLMVKIWTEGEGVLNQHLFKVTSNIYPKWFIYFWTKNHLDSFIRIAADKATTMGHIRRHHLTEAKVSIPDKNIFDKVDAYVELLFNGSLDFLLQSESLNELRDTLLPRLMTGEIHTPQAEHFMEGGA